MNHNFIKECKTDIKIFKKDIQKGPFSVRLKNETLNSNTGSMFMLMPYIKGI